jgi:hypothetical protein
MSSTTQATLVSIKTNRKSFELTTCAYYHDFKERSWRKAQASKQRVAV